MIVLSSMESSRSFWSWEFYFTTVLWTSQRFMNNNKVVKFDCNFDIVSQKFFWSTNIYTFDLLLLRCSLAGRSQICWGLLLTGGCHFLSPLWSQYWELPSYSARPCIGICWPRLSLTFINWTTDDPWELPGISYYHHQISTPIHFSKLNLIHYCKR